MASIESSDFGRGPFNIVNVKARTAVDVLGGKNTAEGQPRTAAATQKWTLARTANNHWTVKNWDSAKYLGIRMGEKASHGFHVCAVDDHAFEWVLRKDTKNPNYVIFQVPYTDFVLDLEGYGNANPGTKVQLWNNLNGDNQKWVLSKGLDEAISSALSPGSFYRIVNDQTKTVIQLNDTQQASGFKAAESTSQQWQPVKTTTGWAFRNVATKQFLGLPLSTSATQNGTRFVGVSHEFTWLVIPDVDETRFKIWVPYTGKLINLSYAMATDNTAVDAWDDWNQGQMWWRFERVGPTEGNSDGNPDRPQAGLR